MNNPFNFWAFLEIRELGLGKKYYFIQWLKGQFAFVIGMAVTLLLGNKLPHWTVTLQLWSVFNGFVVGMILLLEYAMYRTIKRFIEELASQIAEELKRNLK